MAYRTHALVCAGTGCVSNESLEFKEALEARLKEVGLENEVLVVTTGCNGFCGAGPVMLVRPDGIFYQQCKVEDVPRFVEEHFLKGRPVSEKMFVPPEPKDAEPIPLIKDIKFFGDQMLVALRNRGLIDPEKIDDYIARGGYAALGKALAEMTPQQVLDEIKKSGLRGRGGGGFPTGTKWELCRDAPGDKHYVICNADEGDPGAFMDRSIIEGDPHSVLEGMLIGAYAIGSDEGYIYVRMEYPLAVKRFKIAIEQAREYGLLGKNILGTSFSFDVQVRRGAGAFVCGEETALLASIEARAGEPRTRPPYPARSGLWEKPTNINNVETWANVPMIIARGSDWYSSIGTETSKGTKVFSLAGNVFNTGLVEVPMGITIRKIVFDIGGGVPGGKQFKAAQTGGPSGGCIPKEMIDLPIDYESLTEAGSMMGSGGLVVMDEDACMVDVARYFLSFTQEESCGKCTPCREGTKRMLEILTLITEGKGTQDDLAELEELAHTVKETALCGLGQTAPNPVLTTLKYFRDEYEQHIKYKRCPAAYCKGIISSPCHFTCPVGIDVPSYIGFIAAGELDRALECIRKDNPLPGICGRVCHHPCEDTCIRGIIDDPVAICSLKRLAADYELQSRKRPHVPRIERRDERVAVVGAGPAGLTCAYFLALAGYRVTIFEALSAAGGMLRVGIPEYRLPREILDREIEAIKAAGVEIVLDTALGKDFTLDSLKGDGFRAIFLATGAHKGLKLGIEGEDADGVWDCVTFLKDVNLGSPPDLKGKRVGVIGGGNAAIDCARSALRLGASDVSIIYRRSRAEMPAIADEVDAADEEGITLMILAAPKRCISSNGSLSGVECMKMELGEHDESGRRRPVPIEGSEFTVDLDVMLPAISQEPDTSWLPEGHPLKIGKWSNVVTDRETAATNVEGVFAGGDVVRGADTVIWAMCDGKRAAGAIDRYLRGEKLEPEYSVVTPRYDVAPPALSDEEMDEVAEMPRTKVPAVAPKDRSTSFKEAELGFAREDGMREALRCLRCDKE